MTLNRRLQREFLRRAVERSRYENACLREVVGHLRAASRACVAAVRSSGLFHLSTPGGETTLGILDPGSRGRLDAVVERCAAALGTVASGGMTCLGAHLPAFAELELRQIPELVNERVRDAAQAAALAEAADLLERAEPEDDCTWVTIRGHPVCIGGLGHGRHGRGNLVARIARSNERAWPGGVVRVRAKLSKRETGKIGEAVAIAWLQSRGLRDARPLNAHAENFGADVIAGNQVIEVKAGRAGNSAKAQQWRLTIGEPGKREKAWLRTASARAKRAWNERKERMIVARKNEIVREVGRALGRRAVGRTITAIVNPDTRVADLYAFDGFHARIGWSSAQAREAYVGSVRYSVKLQEAADAGAAEPEDDEEEAVTLTGADEAVPAEVEDEFAAELEREAKRYRPALRKRLKQQAAADEAVALLDAIDAEPDRPEEGDEVAASLDLRAAIDLAEYIVRVAGGYRVVSHQTGRNLGTFPTRAQAQRRLRQLARFREACGDSIADAVLLLEAPADDAEEVGHAFAPQRGLFPPPAPHLGAVFASVPEGQVAALLSSPLGGARYADAFSDMAAGLLRRVRNVLTTGLIQGRGVGSVAKDVQAAVGGARFAAERIVRSEFVRTAATSALQVFDANKSALNGVQWVATLDDATCLQCGELDGTVYDDPEDADVPVDDTHPNCRCVLVPVVKGGEELGFGPATRASMDGEVPETQTYADWFADQDAETQRDVLGPTRYRLYKSGRAKLGNFVSAHGVRSVRDVLKSLGEATADYHLAERAATLLEYSDDQARDERGRWVTGYHGTTSGRAGRVGRRGLRATKPGQFTVTRDPKVALSYARERARQRGGTPAVFKVRVPARYLSPPSRGIRTGRGQPAVQHTMYSVARAIPARYVTRLEAADLLEYSPDQPRVPAGSPEGGEFAGGGGGGKIPKHKLYTKNKLAIQSNFKVGQTWTYTGKVAELKGEVLVVGLGSHGGIVVSAHGVTKHVSPFALVSVPGQAGTPSVASVVTETGTMVPVSDPDYKLGASMDDGKALAEHLAKELKSAFLTDTKYGSTAVLNFKGAWNNSSSTWSGSLMRAAANELWGGTIFKNGNTYESAHDIYALLEEHLSSQFGAKTAGHMGQLRDEMKRYMRAQYGLTQKNLAGRKLETVTLYRGVRKAAGIASWAGGQTVKFAAGALSSFSLSQKTANGFGSYTVRVDVPRSAIFSTHETGPGVTSEKEYLVIGDRTPFTARVTRAPGYHGQPVSEAAEPEPEPLDAVPYAHLPNVDATYENDDWIHLLANDRIPEEEEP